MATSPNIVSGRVVATRSDSVAADDAIGNGAELAHLLFVNHFEVGDGGLAVAGTS